MLVLRLSLWFGPNTEGLWGMTVSGSDALLNPGTFVKVNLSHELLVGGV